MKHLLNNMSEEEKNSIREQHTGGMKVMAENFNKLLNSKLGDAKPLVKEQDEDEYAFLKNDDGKLDLNKLDDYMDSLPNSGKLPKAEKGPFASADERWFDSDDRQVDEPTDYSEEKSFGPNEYESFMNYINNCNTKWCLTTKRMYDTYANKNGGIKVRKESTLSEQGFHPVEGKLDDEERLNQLLDFVRKNAWTQKNVLGNKFAKYVEDGGSIWEKNGKVLIISPTKNYFYSEMKLNGPFNLSQMSKYIK